MQSAKWTEADCPRIVWRILHSVEFRRRSGMPGGWDGIENRPHPPRHRRNYRGWRYLPPEKYHDDVSTIHRQRHHGHSPPPSSAAASPPAPSTPPPPQAAPFYYHHPPLHLPSPPHPRDRPSVPAFRSAGPSTDSPPRRWVRRNRLRGRPRRRGSCRRRHGWNCGRVGRPCWTFRSRHSVFGGLRVLPFWKICLFVGWGCCYGIGKVVD
mmetsp:Transcript_29612/g.54639  ORF Transcript_29612/g.54639 Transcript_29612/m.54639 type:complete len:209 (-) Transcript_29612:6-632(-)